MLLKISSVYYAERSNFFGDLLWGWQGRQMGKEQPQLQSSLTLIMYNVALIPDWTTACGSLVLPLRSTRVAKLMPTSMEATQTKNVTRNKTY